ncbi:hypothetical protein [Nocardia aobensis]|uniref:hypothetical protein n=1 Tax=Nocardia aobensis TaxID=257277 RepID=UPI0002EE67B0|nr:hypothetical protein [Nocardia aobensis]
MAVGMRRIGAAAAAGALGSLLAVSVAGADVTGVRVDAGASGLRTGCSATLTATVDTPVPDRTVTFINSGGSVPGNGEPIAGTPVYHPENGTVTMAWTPKYTGRQNITAQQFKPGSYTSSSYITVDVVGSGLNTGSSCLPLP